MVKALYKPWIQSAAVSKSELNLILQKFFLTVCTKATINVIILVENQKVVG